MTVIVIVPNHFITNGKDKNTNNGNAYSDVGQIFFVAPESVVQALSQ